MTPTEEGRERELIYTAVLEYLLWINNRDEFGSPNFPEEAAALFVKDRGEYVTSNVVPVGSHPAEGSPHDHSIREGTDECDCDWCLDRRARLRDATGGEAGSGEVADGEREPVAWDGVYGSGARAPYGPFRTRGQAAEWVGNTNPDAHAYVEALYATSTPAKDSAAHSGEEGEDAQIRGALERILWAHEDDFKGDHDAAIQHGHDVLNARLRTTREPGGDDG